MVSPSICLLMAGVAGIFLFIGLRARKGSKSKERKSVVVDDNHCACCLAPLLISRGVRCNDCGAKTCRKSCSRWDTSDNAWNCIFCNQRRAWMRRNEKWFENFGSTTNEKEDSFLHSFFGTVKSQVIAGHAVAKNMEQIQEDQEEKRTVHVIRNFVEKIVEGLIENVDDTSINRLYKNSEYEKFLEEHRPPLITALTQLATCLETSLTNKPSMDPPATAHAALKEIVERAVEEARKLPGLGSSTDTEHPREGRPIADNSYEDLLATAILNKVVEKFQRERVDGNSNVLHDTDSPKAKYTTESEHGLEEDAVSYESYHRECSGNRSASIRRNVDNREPVSFMMEEQIEEVTTITSDDDEFRGNDIMEFECTRRVPFPELGMDIIDPPRELSSSSDSSDLDRNEYSPARTKRHVADRAMDLISPVESWEDNWLFQKKRTSRTQPDAVSMLVPSSNAYYKALIGDKDAEDTSDLSECSSTKSDEEIEKELMEAINNVVPRTPKTSESDAKKNQTENNQEVPNVTHIENDEIGVCQTKIEIEKNLSEKVCEHFDEKIKEKLLKSSKISEKKIIKDENDKEKLSESSFMLITAAKEEDKTKEKPKDTTDCGERIFLESSVRKNANTQFEKSSERNDRPENVADEDEEQRESEYTEHYDTAIQRHLDSLTKVEICFGENEMIETCKTMNEQFKELINDSIEEQGSERSQTEVQLSYVTTDENHIDITAENDRLSAPPRPGTIAEREHKKWENAPPIENNPYSEESIRKRCLERQYSKNSDISGVHYDLTKLNEVNLEALTPDRSDIKRFGRDYYINQSKAASGERQEQAIRSTMSSTMSSRPSSSLSQRSSCTGDEQREQQQVSHHELEQFEAASLRDSLPRQRCRDPLASAHFAINPLLHLKLTNDRLCHDDDERVKNVTENGRMNDRKDRENMIEDTKGDRGFTNLEDSDLEAIVDQEDNYIQEKNLEIDTNFEKLISTNQFWSDHDENAGREVEEPIVPRYDASRGGLPDNQDNRDLDDHDSGIGSRDSVISDRDRWRRLYRVAENNEQISSIGGRRFWTSSGYKYHTFGGIKIQLRKGEYLDDLEDESTSLSEDQFADYPLEFAKLKSQTFGGIKRSRKIDGSKIPNYRRIRLRPNLLEAASVVPDTDKNRDRIVTGRSTNFELYSNIDHLGNFDHLANLNRSTSFKGLASFEHSTNSIFEESDWQDEEDEIANSRVSAGGRDVGKNRTIVFKTSSAMKYRNPIRKKNVNSSSVLSLENEDDEWQDEINSISDKSIMNKFLNDISKKRKIYTFSDDDVARRGRETRSRRHREIFEEDNSRKLDKLINRNTKKSLDSSKKLRRMQEQKSDDKRRKLDVTSLSDVTIW